MKGMSLDFKTMTSMTTKEQALGINHLCNIVHEANQKWWICLECKDHPGFIQVYAQRVTGDTTPILVSVPCPNCMMKGNDPGKLFRNVGELLALSHSELSEALEGHRKNLKDDKLPHRKMLEVELADAIIRIFDISAGLGLDLGGAFVEKMEYNRTRKDHSLEERMKEGGKKY